MNKGFTLVELLTVLVILSAISLIAVVLTGPTIKNSRQELSDIQISKIEEAAKIYYLKEGLGSFDYENDEHKTCVNLSYLLEKNYLDGSEIINAKNNEEMNGSVKITYSSNQYNYKYQDTACSNNDLGIICTAVTEATTGTIPSSTEGYVLGDEYMCEVKSGTRYRFFVLSEEEKNVNLIMERNLYYNSDSDTGLADSTNTGITNWGEMVSDGPNSSMNYLHNATKNWSNISNIKIDYTNSQSDYTIKTFEKNTKIINKTETIIAEFLDLKSRLPFIEELKSAGCEHDDENKIDLENASCPLWLANYTNSPAYASSEKYQQIDNISGYLTSDSSDSLVILISYGSIHWEFPDAYNGVRPVISISKNAILD